ncbi:MAG: hypothetical protein FGM46_01420 [Ferruginibacter sp.]|nr:hypothetical protein [Ferruginibacter sp.]
MKYHYILFLLFFFSCQPQKKNDAPSKDTNFSQIDLLDIDKSFSLECKTKGLKNTFINQLDSNGIVIRNGHKPLEGANAIDYFLMQDDSDIIFSRLPKHSFIAESGDLGFTYGMYSMHSKTLDTVLYGSYSSVWKRQKDGKWKLLLDSNNEGIED